MEKITKEQVEKARILYLYKRQSTRNRKPGERWESFWFDYLQLRNSFNIQNRKELLTKCNQILSKS